MNYRTLKPTSPGIFAHPHKEALTTVLGKAWFHLTYFSENEQFFLSMCVVFVVV